MNDTVLINKSEQVESIYGYWPSFHDAEDLSIKFQRDISAKLKQENVIIELNYWETKAINEGASALDYILDKNMIITLLFSEILTSIVESFNF